MTRRKSQDEDWSSLETASETMVGPARSAAGDPAGAGDGAETKPPRKSGRLLDVLIVISAVFMIAALCLIAYPTFSDWWNRMHQSYAVAAYVEQTEDLSSAEKQTMLGDAREYNEKLAANGDRWHMTAEQKKLYDETLDVTGTGIIGYVTIPRIKVKLPIYHGTGDGVLQIAAGHLLDRHCRSAEGQHMR